MESKNEQLNPKQASMARARRCSRSVREENRIIEPGEPFETPVPQHRASAVFLVYGIKLVWI